MSLAELIPLALKASILLTVFAFGLRASPDDATYLMRRPGQLLRALLAMNVIVPLWAASLAITFALHPAVEIVLLALAVSPVPPLLPKKMLKAGGNESYTIGLLVAAAVLAIVVVPLSVKLMGRVFGTSVAVPTAAVARLVFATVLLPLAAGMTFRHAAPAYAEAIAETLARLANALLIVTALPILLTAWPSIVSLIGNGTIAAMAARAIVALAVGYHFGGPDPEHRAALALASAARHPGIAMAIAGASFPGQRLVFAAVLLYTIVSALASMPYVAWSRRQRARVVRAIVT